VIGLVGFLLAVTMAPAPATGRQAQQTHTIEIVKVIDGDEPEGVTYAVALECDDPAFSTSGPLTPFSPFTHSRDAAGGDVSCTLSEPEDAGALSTTIECEVLSGSGSCVEGDSVSFVADQSGGVRFTVTNSFPDIEPPPPPPVVDATPAFTG
jgi:hypothetical protein